MVGRAAVAGVTLSWVAGDEGYGGNPGVGSWLEGEGIAYVMAVACSEMITTAAGRFRAGELAALGPASGWQRLSCAHGSKGPRLYDWALIRPSRPPPPLLARRSPPRGGKGKLELAFLRSLSTPPARVHTRATRAGAAPPPRRGGPPPVQPAHSRHPPGGFP